MKARTPFSTGLVACAALILGLAPASSAAAETFTVTNGASSGTGSLRQAILDANATPGHDTIDFAAGVNQVAISASSEITEDLDIDGPGTANLQLVGSGSRIFEVAESTAVAVSGMTIKMGGTSSDVPTGGAIANAGNLTLTEVEFDNNRASDSSGNNFVGGGAITNTGVLRLRNAAFNHNAAAASRYARASGGAILNSGSMKIIATRFNVNSAAGGDVRFAGHGGFALGGAIANNGRMRIIDSTFRENYALGGDGGDYGGDALGGAVYNFGNGTAIIQSSTFYGNIADGGRVDPRAVEGGDGGGGALENTDSATFQLKNATLFANTAAAFSRHASSFGGGIENFGRGPASTVLATTMSKNTADSGSSIQNSKALSLQDTILASPRTRGEDPAQNCGHSADIESLGYNLDSGSSCGLKATGDKSDTDPQLGNLADNGGPTQTIAIPLSSPALDQGVSGGLKSDQRDHRRPVIVPGVPRPEGGDGSDIGAYEYQPGPRGHSRIKGSVRPGRAHAGERTCFDFVAERPTGGPMRKAQVRFAGKRARTDERGRATICKRFKHAGVRHPRLRKRGHERARLRVKVRS